VAKKPAQKAPTPKEPEGLSRFQKVGLGAFLAFIPFFFLILLPLLTRDYLCKTLSIAPEILLSTPLKLQMNPSGDSMPKIKLRMLGIEFQIPLNYTPVRISPDTLTFRNNSRRIARTISVSIRRQPPRLDLKTSGIISLFMPSKLNPFLQNALWATWHPVRLYCKAQFLVSQGIGGSFFESDWDAHHHGFVFPTPANTGYMARVFDDRNDHYIEFAFFDETDPVTLAEWVDVAICLKPPTDAEKTLEPPARLRSLSLAATLEKASKEASAQSAIQDALNEFLLNGDVSWLLPCGIVMENRLYFRELIELCKIAIPLLKEKPQELALWRDLFERCIKQMLKIEVDPNHELEEVVIYVKNLSKFSLKRIRLKITCVDADGERTFSTVVQKSGNMLSQDEKSFTIPTEHGFLSKKLQGINWAVEDLDIGD